MPSHELYNVWTPDLAIDEWTYNLDEAIALREHIRKEYSGKQVTITVYEEDENGAVNTADGFYSLEE